MAVPSEHLTYLQRKDYKVPRAGVLDDAEAALLRDYGHWMEALAAGWIVAVTAEQKHFVQVARGEADPVTPFERVWRKVNTPEAAPAGSDGLGAKVAQLAEVRRYSDELHARKQAERDAVLKTVQAQLEAIDRKYARELEEADQAVAELEGEVKAEVLKAGSSVRSGPVQAVYYRGSVTWDSKGLAAYAEAHPELERFRKVGAPRVVIRYR